MTTATRLSPLTPIRDADFGYEQARHLLWRAGFGGSPEQIQTLSNWGPKRAVDHLLDVKEIAYDRPRADAFDRDIMQPPTREQRAAIARARRERDEEVVARFRAERQNRQRRDRRQIRLIQRWWLTRMIETPRPLEEKMVLFWHGHFATSYRTIENSYHMYLQNQLFRTHALGNYGRLLHQIIRDPAMIAYLDNNDSRRNRPNENLAREIMELFSLGVGNYTEKDIKEGARALTGYTFVDDEFTFQPRNHDDGPKAILGRSGRMDGDDFVNAILARRACSRHMCRKLYKFFVAGVPESSRQTDPEANSVIRSLASLFAARDYEIKPVLRKLFLSEHFYGPGVMNEQIKSPAELTVGAIRTLNVPPRDLSILLDAMDLMGQSVLFPPSVKGWDGGRSWINTSTLFVRQNTLSYLLTGKKPAGYDALANLEKYDPMPLLSPLARVAPGADRDAAQVVDYLMRFTLGRTPPRARKSLLAFMAGHDNRVTPEIATGLLLLITAMPEYQLC
ncbi:MAG: DUF1800 domain-containing protein [Planctomycetes bacterium]|nr:DUF1800 domain-containing protein [Planctomycetota bacterium]